MTAAEAVSGPADPDLDLTEQTVLHVIHLRPLLAGYGVLTDTSAVATKAVTHQSRPSFPYLFRLTLINTAKRRELRACLETPDPAGNSTGNSTCGRRAVRNS